MTKAREHMIQALQLAMAGKKKAAKEQLKKADNELEIQYAASPATAPRPTVPAPSKPRPNVQPKPPVKK
jgi:hypothetical protein